MGLTGAQRAALYLERQRERGLVSVTILVPIGAVAEFREMGEALRTHPHLLPGPLRDPRTGRLVSVATALRSAPVDQTHD